MYKIRQTSEFRGWLSKLKDVRANTVIVRRIERIAEGNFGDHKSIGEKISEIRITHGPGYRLYYTIKGKIIVLLLIGGDKSTQKSDISKAKILLNEIEETND